MNPVRILYFSDILCVWAYAAQRRLEQLIQTFGDEISIDAHFCSIFPDAWGKIEQNWKDRDGFAGFGRHVNQVARKFPHIEVHDQLWCEARPRSSASAHLFIKAVELIEGNSQPYLERKATRAAWAVRRAFFASLRDVSDWRVLAEIAGELDINYDLVRDKIRSSEAVALLATDYNLSKTHGVESSPTFIMNEGRQKLVGNVGYRLIEANVQELLRNPAVGEASWC
jgi:predicted DsbA family dithiol-disulfide isomerase